MGATAEAVLAALIAFGATAALTPVTGVLAKRLRIVDRPRGRGLAPGGIPLLGGLAMLFGVGVAALIVLAPFSGELAAVLQAALVIGVVGTLDDRFDLHPALKLIGQVAAAVIAVRGGVIVENITFPFLGAVSFGWAGGPLSVLGLVAVMNVVNFSDGIDGLAAGIAGIAAIAFAVVAFDLGKIEAGTLSAITAGAAFGFLIFNFSPASIYMGDVGANLLGLLLGCVAVLGAVKTQAVLALILPAVILAVPVLDTAFVVLKRIKYRQPVYNADREHFHHRLDRAGYSTRKAVLVLYAWTALMAALAIAMRFIPYSDNRGHFHTGWLALMLALLVVGLAASVAVVYVLEILKVERSGRHVRIRMGGPPVRRPTGTPEPRSVVVEQTGPPHDGP